MSFENIPWAPIPESRMTETDPVIIDAQIAAILERSGDFSFISNFDLNFPGRFYRNLIEGNNWMDNPLMKPDDEERYPGNVYSERGRIATWRDFFSDVDAALQESDVNQESLKQIRGLQITDPAEYKRKLEEYQRSLLPVYRSLRITGYSHDELTR